RLFEEYLIAPLDRALALAKADARAVLVDRDLRLEVTHALEAPLEVEAFVAERCLRLGARLVPETLQLRGRRRLAHAAATAAGLRLEHHWIADRFRDAQGLSVRAHGPVRSGNDRQAKLLHRRARLRLVMEVREHLGRRTDEDEAVIAADLGEVRALGEEAVPGVDRLRAADECGRDDRGDVQIRVARRGGADADGLVRQMHGQAVCVGLAVHDDRLDPKLAARADDSERDLAAVGDEDLIEGQEAPPSTWSRQRHWRPSVR